MDRRSWLWRRKSSEKSPGETESSGSVSSYSERYSDDQEVSKASPNHARSPGGSSNVASCEDNDTIKSLTEKLSSALLSIRAKEELVKQHAKVAEEAVSGWEKAEKEVSSLRQQLETAAQKNSALEDRISQLDAALKECVRQVRQSREEEERKVQDAMVKKAREWESEKLHLESQLIELEVQLEAAKEAPASVSHELQCKLEEFKKENAIFKSELLARSEELNMRTLERDLSNRAAETASKQHLESIKKVTKLEAECRRLQAVARKSSLSGHNPYVSSAFVESHSSDSLSESGKQLLALDNEPSCSDAWASALIAELDQFKSGKAVAQKLTATSVEIDLMDDFLEMEKLVALPEIKHDSPLIEPQVNLSIADTGNSTMEAELTASLRRTSELEKTNEKIETEKAEMERLLAETQDRLEGTCKQLEETEKKLTDLQRQLQFDNDLKQVAETALHTAEEQRKLLELQLDSASSQMQEQREKVGQLEGQVEEERALSSELARKCHNLEGELSKSKEEAELRSAAISKGELKIKQEKGLAVAAEKFAECQKTIASLKHQLKSLAAVDDLTREGEKVEFNGESPVLKDQKERKTCLSDTPEGDSPSSFLSRKELYTFPPLSSSSSSSSFQDMKNPSLKVGAIAI